MDIIELEEKPTGESFFPLEEFFPLEMHQKIRCIFLNADERSFEEDTERFEFVLEFQ